MRRFLLISVLLLGTVSLFAQAKDGMSNIEDSISVYYDSFFKYFREEDYERAIYYGSRLKDKWEEAKWEKDSIYCGIAYALANLYNVEGRPELSASILTELAPTAKTVFGDNSLDYVEIISDLAHYHSAFANYTEAMRLGTEVLNIRKKVLGTEHPEYAIALGNLAHYKSALGNYAEAIRLGTEAMEIRKRTVGTEHPDYAAALSNLAHYYSETGNNSEAAVLGTEALEIYKKAYGTEHPDYALALGNLGNYYSNLGNYEEAIRLGIEAIEIKKRVLGTEHPDYATALSNLAHDLAAIGDYTEAIRLGTKAIEIRKEVLGTEHPAYATALSNLATYLSETGDYAEAIRLGTEAMEIRKKALGTEHPDYAMSLNNIAADYSDIGNFTEAIRLGKEANEIYKRMLGTEHPDYAAVLSNLASYYSSLGNHAEEFSCINQSLESSRQYVLSSFSELSPELQETLWNENYEYMFNIALPMTVFRYQTDESVAALYDKTALFSKGILLNTGIAMRQLIIESGDPAIIAKYDALSANVSIYEEQMEMPVQERSIDTDSLHSVIQRQEMELARESKAFGDYSSNIRLNWKDIQKRLDKDDIAIEFITFPLFETDSTMYVALTVKKGYKAPHMTTLFEKNELSAINTSLYKRPELSRMVWGRLAGELEGVKDIFFSPSGELYNIAIESVPHWEKDCMMSDMFNLYRLSSTRELAMAHDKTKSDGAVVYGGINYDTEVSAMGTPRTDAGTLLAQRGFVADSTTYRGGGWPYLKGTLEEADEVCEILKHSKTKVSKITGKDATETTLKDLSGKRKRMLHIATHGFYWSETDARRQKRREGMRFLNMGDAQANYVEDKAMTRSGLLFSGAENTFSGVEIPAGVDDGVLTAQEISRLDLRGLDLLVLSACQTGLGEITGDGVFGLQRGFKKAGARTIVMSLWSVSDNATKDLMTQFYTALAAGKNKRQAFAEAQRYLKEHDSDYGYFPSSLRLRRPHWAAFIMLDGTDR